MRTDATALRRRAIMDSLFVSARIFTRLGRDGAATMAEQRLMDMLDRPRCDRIALDRQAVIALEMARDAGRAFVHAGLDRPS